MNITKAEYRQRAPSVSVSVNFTYIASSQKFTIFKLNMQMNSDGLQSSVANVKDQTSKILS